MGFREKQNSLFVNPYNFIEPIGNCSRGNDTLKNRKKDELITGVINCSLITKTDLFIPNTSNDNVQKNNEAEHKSYDFFSYDNVDMNNLTKNPIIPGSSIRGVIRSIYEALTNSCFSVIDDESVLYKRLPIINNKGIIRKEGSKFLLYKVDGYRIKISECNKAFSKIKETKDCDYIWVKANSKGIVNDIRYSETAGFKKCLLIKGNKMFSKKSYTAFDAVLKKENQINLLNLEDLDRLEKVLKLYENTGSGFDSYYKALKKLLNNEINEIPVYYKEINNKYYLSPACITKQVFDNTIGTILNDMGNFNTCNNIKDLCETCELFGIVTDNEAANSKLRFGDARLVDNQKNVFGNFITLNELSSPKISSTEFYLKTPEKKGDMWTYDYNLTWKDNKGNYTIDKSFRPKLRGRKIYLHHKDKVLPLKIEKNKRNITIRPVKKSVKFEFKIYFDRIKEEELKKIIWTLTLGENNDNSLLQHKIGLGKPLGLGSVKIKIDSIKKRVLDLSSDNIYNIIDCSNQYLDNLSSLEEQFNSEISNQIKAAFSVKNEYKTIIRYPLASKGKKETTFQWFVSNKCFNGGAGTKPKIYKTLPKITDKDLTLCDYEEYNNNNRNYKGNRR